MSTKQAFEEAREGLSAMESLMKRGLGTSNANPLQEFVGGSCEQAIEYARVERKAYVGEVGKRDGSYIYHFWPRTLELTEGFDDKLANVMLAVFKYPERLSAKHDVVMRCFEGEKNATAGDILCRFWGTPDDFKGDTCPNCGSGDVRVTQSSWAAKVTGYADNPLADDLAASVFDKLDALF